MTNAIITAIDLVSFVVIAIILAVVANTMAMTARERIGEYAIFKTLGFSGWRIAGLIFGESHGHHLDRLWCWYRSYLPHG